MRKLTALAVAMCTFVASAEEAEPRDDKPVAIVLDKPSIVAMEGQMIELPPGIFMPQSTYNIVNDEIVRLQAVEADSKGHLKLVAGAFFAGLVVGTGAAILVLKPWEKR